MEEDADCVPWTAEHWLLFLRPELQRKVGEWLLQRQNLKRHGRSPSIPISQVGKLRPVLQRKKLWIRKVRVPC